MTDAGEAHHDDSETAGQQASTDEDCGKREHRSH